MYYSTLAKISNVSEEPNEFNELYSDDSDSEGSESEEDTTNNNNWDNIMLMISQILDNETEIDIEADSNNFDYNFLTAFIPKESQMLNGTG
ncbi:hypothetical protein F8M41_002185 [Gigaspora margarita]|uniref:Uncharacterized protein n=1 Tax=Gigaspora margarita TaxID=4874 RepID=A0A8H4A8P0_GIGMA|nr:hypothetical protein F8M41_002185 [Gigaspora margarita]